VKGSFDPSEERREVMSANTTLLEERVFGEVKRLCYVGLDETTLLREAAERLRRVVPFEAYCAFVTDPMSRLIMRSLAEEMGGEREERIFFEHVYFEDEFTGYDWAAKGRLPVELTSEATGGRLERSLRYRELISPLGLHYEARSVYTVGGELWGGLDLIRERGRQDFERCQVRLLRRIVPHLSSGLKAGVLHPQQSSESVGSAVIGMLVLDHHGRVAQYNRGAERWLRELEDLGDGWQEGPGLPAAVWMVRSALRKALNPETERDRARVPRLCARARSGQWLTLHASQSEPLPGRGSETMIVIEPAGPKEMAWLGAAAYGLSPREKEVVDLVVRSASTKHIAATLYISEYTVQKHLSNVFEKVGVRSRQALVKRLFFDNLYPAIFA
jgi:DNA-binding CsgD family transcriptional regulator